LPAKNAEKGYHEEWIGGESLPWISSIRDGKGKERG
jgi:hypothetical protein